MKRFAQSAFDLLWPPCCESCGEPSRDPVCAACRAAMPLRTADGCCSTCGKTLLEGEADRPGDGATCRRCRDEPPWFDAARSAVSFRGPARPLVHALKYGGQTWLAGVLSTWLEGCWLAHFADERPDFVSSPPMHPLRRLRRGYDQARLLAAALADALGLPCECGLVARRRATPTQTRLDAEERAANVRDAFAVVPGARERIVGKCILLVDDVMTTGATLGALSRVYREAGAERIICMSFARD